MKKIVLFLSLLVVSSTLFFAFPESADFSQISKVKSSFDTSILKEGDVIFQTDNYGQSLAVQKATLSKYSHVGILFKENGAWMVYEAIQPVVKSNFNAFIKRGDKGHFTISR